MLYLLEAAGQCVLIYFQFSDVESVTRIPRRIIKGNGEPA
jgi:hypothetical protein